MSATKPVAKKQKLNATKKPSTRKPAAKPIKLGGVPNQGSLG